MKIFSVTLFALVALVEAGIPKPEVLIGINVGADQTGTLGGIEPKVRWSSSGAVAGIDVAGGIELSISDLDTPPATSVWAKLKKSFAKVGDVSIRGDVDTSVPDNVDLDVRANGFGTSVQLLGQAGSKTNSVSYIQVTKDISTIGGVLTVTPKYNVDAGEGDLSVGYAMDGTSIKVDAQKKQLTVAHAFSKKDTIIPTINLAGDVSLSYSRSLDQGRITTTYTPNDSVKLQWSDGVYETTIKAPLDGYYKTNRGIKVNMKRTVEI